MLVSNRLSILRLMFVLNFQPFVKSLSNAIGVKVFSDYLGGHKFNRLAINNKNGMVYIGATNKLYKLSSDIELLANVTTCSLFDPENYNKILVVDYQNNQLVICGTSTKCPCSAYNYIDNKKKLTLVIKTTQEIALGSANASVVAFFPHSYFDGYERLFVAVSNNGCFFNSSAMAVRYTTPNAKDFLRNAYENTNYHVNKFRTDHQHYCRVNYAYGFTSGKYNYFLTTQLNYSAQRSAFISKLIRVCDWGSPFLKGYSEIPIECKFGNDTPYNLVQAATVGKANPLLAKSLNIGHNDDVLFAIFSKSRDMEATDYEPSNHSALCISSLAAIDEKFTENIRNCFEGKGNRGFGSLLLNPECLGSKYNWNFCWSEINIPFDGNQPIIKSPVVTFNTRMTAIASKQNENHNDVFIGTNTGHLKNIKVINSTTAYELIDLPIDEGSPVNSDLLFSPNEDSLYIMTEYNLTKIKIPIILENCSKNENFSTCIQSIFNYCGWCESNNKCTWKYKCPNDKYSSWYSHDFRNNLKIAVHNSDKSHIKPGERLILKITNLPSINDTFFCTFFLKNETVQTVATSHKLFVGFKVTCLTPKENDILKMSPIVDNPIIKLSLRTEHLGDVASTYVTFSRCFTFTSCNTCVSNKFECHWHSTNKECFYDPKITDVEPCEIIPTKKTPRSPPSISSFWPEQGPIKGGTNITIDFNTANSPPKFWLYPNPKFDYFITSSTEAEYGEYIFVIIMGQNINKACQKSDIIVTIDGNHTCEVMAVSSNQVICRLEKSFLSHSATDSEKKSNDLKEFSRITVSIGNFFRVYVYKQENSHNSENPSKNYLFYGVMGIMTIIIFMGVASYSIVWKKMMAQVRTAKKLQQQVNIMGMEAITMKQYMKRVVIKNQIGVNESFSKILKLPNVEIENTSILKDSSGTSAQSEYILPPDDEWEFPKSNLTLGVCLGKGEFGKVVQGEAKGILKDSITTIVAVKMLKDNYSDEDMIDLVSEMEIMKLIGTHNNVLRLLGCCTKDGVLFVITEYAKHGNLREFLRKHLSLGNESRAISLSQKNLMFFSKQVAVGMDYLASIKCVHRDLAARNILVSDNNILKIGDFGLARDITNKEYYRKRTDGRLPVKWMAPESIVHSIYSTQSDIWSYGILLWEIFTLGGAPYPSLQDVGKLYQDLRSGYRMEKPSNCSAEIYSLMHECWSFEPNNRPSFSTIVKNLEGLLLSHETLERCNMDLLERNESNDRLEDETDNFLV